MRNLSVSRLGSALFALASLTLVGCSSDKPPIPAQPTDQAPTPSPPPVYTKSQVEESILKPIDLGKKWEQNELSVTEFREGKLRGCSLSSIEIPGSPEIVARKYGEPDRKLRGANYAQFFAIYSSPEKASEAFNKVKKKVLDCPPKKSVPIKRLPDKKFLYPHEDTWTVTESSISGWEHIRGFEKAVYPPSASTINVYHMPIDYTLRSNIIFSSLYWQRTSPKDPSKPIVDKATGLLIKQLNKFG